ncbi:MAG: SYNERG-CTERM sorting domain-containing protein, partial [Synergistaceae bacterium]|nr:SYNERG-CTERM sorting domain-containing protein [Synergistaceae bacterium]
TLTNCAGPTGMTGSTADPAYVTISNWTAPRSADVPVDGVTHTVFRIEENLTALRDLINKGTSMNALADDQLGTPRKSPPDIGAVEHVHAFGTDWEHDGAEHWHECASCGARADEASHAFGDWTETKPATATEEGEKERVCSVCQYRETRAIPKTGGDPTGSPGATLSAVGVPTTGGMAEVPLSGIVTFELGMWFGEDRKPATPQSLTVYVDGEARGEVSVTGGRFVLPAIDDDEYELQVEATLPDGTTLKSDKLYVVAGRGTLTATKLTVTPTSANEGERVTFDLGEWLNKREVVVPEGVRWILNGVDVTDLVTGGKLTVEAIDGGGGTMTLIVTATLPNGLTGTATVRVTVTPAPDEGDEEETPGGSGGCFNVGFGGLAMMACAALILRRRS